MTADEDDKTILSRCLQKVEGCQNISAVRGDLRLSSADLQFNRQGREFMIREQLENIKEDYDAIIMDTPPALGILTVNALTSADTVIVLVGPDGYSLAYI